MAAIWGSTFVLVKDAVALYPTLPFLTLRFALATLALAPVVALARWRSRTGRRPDGGAGWRPAIVGGSWMGVVLAAGYLFQTLGLERTSASNAGFITGLFVVLTPMLEAVLLRAWIGRGAFLGVVLAFAGLFLLSGGGAALAGEGGGRLLGDFLVFLCALSFAGHLLVTDRYVSRYDPLLLTVIQLSVVSLICALLAAVAAFLGLLPAPLWLPREPEVWLALGITAIFASALGFYVQTYAQTHAPPTRTAVILTMEPVFAGLFGYLLAGELLGIPGWIGAALILAGMLVSELVPARRRRWVSAEEGTAWMAGGE